VVAYLAVAGRKKAGDGGAGQRGAGEADALVARRGAAGEEKEGNSRTRQACSRARIEWGWGRVPPPFSPSQATRLRARKGTPPKPPLTHDPVDAAQADVRLARTRPGQKFGVGLGVAWEWIGGLCGRRLRRLAWVISDAVLRSATSAPL